jgi:hypothetical protein
MSNHTDLQDDDIEDDDGGGKNRRFNEFECPECDAHNPWEEGFGAGDEILCNYCGQEFVAEVSDSGKLKLKVA